MYLQLLTLTPTCDGTLYFHETWNGELPWKLPSYQTLDAWVSLLHCSWRNRPERYHCPVNIMHQLICCHRLFAFMHWLQDLSFFVSSCYYIAGWCVLHWQWRYWFVENWWELVPLVGVFCTDSGDICMLNLGEYECVLQNHGFFDLRHACMFELIYSSYV